jgi:hypothetical protein
LTKCLLQPVWLWWCISNFARSIGTLDDLFFIVQTSQCLSFHTIYISHGNSIKRHQANFSKTKKQEQDNWAVIHGDPKRLQYNVHTFPNLQVDQDRWYGLVLDHIESAWILEMLGNVPSNCQELLACGRSIGLCLSLKLSDKLCQHETPRL